MTSTGNIALAANDRASVTGGRVSLFGGGMDSPNMTMLECAKYIKVSPTTIWKLRKLYQIPFLKIGARVLFHKPTIDKWMSNQAVTNVHEDDEHKPLRPRK